MMTFLALLTKEMRLSTRRERTIWVIVTYILLMGLLGWLVINISHTASYGSSDAWTHIGPTLYTVLLFVQLTLVLFVTPAFTATAINGEKERQTFDLLLCSRLSSGALVGGKLFAGLVNALLLITATIPIFSLVFFFGGVTPLQMLQALIVIMVTAIMAATLGMLCSTFFQRPAVSTAVAYMLLLFWLVIPLILYIVVPRLTPPRPGIIGTPAPMTDPPVYLSWSPVMALVSSYTSFFPSVGIYHIGSLSVDIWQIYLVWTIGLTIIFFFLSLLLVKPYVFNRISREKQSQVEQKQETKTTITA